MKEWQVRQEIYRRLNKPTADDLSKFDIVWRPDTIVEDAVRHFKEHVGEWIYPGKSYFVAICYATWIANEFNENLIEVLDDIDLLPGDPHFLPYCQASETYDQILKNLKWHDTDGMVPDVRKYYDEEMHYD
jgi:hypothetical protein